MKEVICTMGRWNFRGPAEKEICVIEYTKTIYGNLYYYLKDYSEISCGQRVGFNSIYFADITGMTEQIQEALKAPAPAERIFNELLKYAGQTAFNNEEL